MVPETPAGSFCVAVLATALSANCLAQCVHPLHANGQKIGHCGLSWTQTTVGSYETVSGACSDHAATCNLGSVTLTLRYCSKHSKEVPNVKQRRTGMCPFQLTWVWKPMIHLPGQWRRGIGTPIQNISICIHSELSRIEPSIPVIHDQLPELGYESRGGHSTVSFKTNWWNANSSASFNMIIDRTIVDF